MEGEPLDAPLRRGPMPLDEALAAAVQIAAAIEAAHERGIVHRDLKPGNVMITRSGLVKVLDFALAKDEAMRESVRVVASPGGSRQGRRLPVR